MRGGQAAERGLRIATDSVEQDAELVARVLAGDPDAYAGLVRRHGGVARRIAVTLGVGEEADDVVQEAFVKAYRALGRFHDGGSFRPWLLRIVANEARNQHRASHRRGAREHTAALLAERLLSDASDPAESVLTYERRKELVAVLQKLSEPHRAVVTCRYLLDLDERETAAVLGWRRGTVKSRLHRALDRLRAGLEAAATAGTANASTRRMDHG